MTSTPASATNGLVETFDREGATGWVELEPGAEPIRVTLHVNAADGGEVAEAFAAEPAARHVSGEARAFAFTLTDLWDFVGPGDRLSVRVGGRTLPVAGQGTCHVPETQGKRHSDELFDRLAAGEVFSRTGALQLSKTLDTTWQAGVLALYDRLRQILADVAGYDAVLAYGTLLGAVREGGFIGHDLDFDAAFVSRHRDAAAAAREMRGIAFAFIDAGLDVRARPTSLTITDPDRPGVLIQLFHLYVDESGTLQFPHGVAGEGTIGPWQSVTEIEFAGAKALVPADAEEVLAHVYGADWRSPKPAFSWATERVSQAVDGFLPPAVVEEIYWAGFYARTTYTTGSTFQQLVQSRELPDAIIDIGCGDGRDSYAFAAAGRTRVTGLDRSHVGVRQATRKAEQLGYDGLSFSACDVGDAPKLRATLRAARTGDDPVTFYLRFFLHSIPEDVQKVLMGVIAECSRPGDHFAAEFRTDRDEAIVKVHGNHYRRFQNGAAFGRSLRETYGFVPLLEQEGNGFSPYKGEDPQLYRVIARRG